MGQQMIDQGRKWKKVEAPKPWRPREVGETLIGEYVGRRSKSGRFGDYEAFVVRTSTGTFHVSGTVLVSLFSAVALKEGDPVRVEYKGTVDSTLHEGVSYRDFDLYVTEGTFGVDQDPFPRKRVAR